MQNMREDEATTTYWSHSLRATKWGNARNSMSWLRRMVATDAHRSSTRTRYALKKFKKFHGKRARSQNNNQSTEQLPASNMTTKCMEFGAKHTRRWRNDDLLKPKLASDDMRKCKEFLINSSTRSKSNCEFGWAHASNKTTKSMEFHGRPNKFQEKHMLPWQQLIEIIWWSDHFITKTIGNCKGDAISDCFEKTVPRYEFRAFNKLRWRKTLKTQSGKMASWRSLILLSDRYWQAHIYICVCVSVCLCVCIYIYMYNVRYIFQDDW